MITFTCSTDTIDEICGLQKCESNRLGFLPRTALLSLLSEKCVMGIAPSHHVSPVGYIVFRRRMRQFPHPACIVQFMVAKEWRSRGYGRSLAGAALRQLATDGCSLVQAWTRTDLVHASHIWQSTGWTAVCERSPDTARRKTAILWRRSLTAVPHPHLLHVPRTGGFRNRGYAEGIVQSHLTPFQPTLFPDDGHRWQ